MTLWYYDVMAKMTFENQMTLWYYGDFDFQMSS